MTQGKTGPGHLDLHATGELEERATLAYDLLQSRTVCPRQCGVNRLADERGFCRTGLLPAIAGYGPHFGKEPPLVGRGGQILFLFPTATLPAYSARITRSARAGAGVKSPWTRLLT